MHVFNKSVQPRNGRRWVVLIVARISTINQDLKSLDDQIALCKREAHRRYGDNLDFRIIKSQVSGEYLDRQELIELESLIESGKIDAVYVEDIGRICRRTRAVDFCEMAEDHDVRLVSINDHIDTTEDGWRNHAFFATMHHETSNKDTSSRIKRSHQNRFDDGAMFQHVIYGYHKPEGKSHENDITTSSEAKKVYDKWFTLLEEGGNFGTVADWLNEEKVTTGPDCELEQWTPEMVARITKNTILKGVRERNRRMSKRINKTGRRKSVKAPPEMLRTRFCPHLVMIDPARYDRVITKLTSGNSCYRRKPKDGVDPRANVPRKRTRWPGQHLICGVCGRPLHFGAHGQMNNLCCSGVRDYHCWNSTSINAPVARTKLLEALFEAIASLSDFDTAMTGELTKAIDEFALHQNQRLVEEKARLEKLESQRESVIDAIVQIRLNDSLKARLSELESEIAMCKESIEQLTEQSPDTPSLPSVSEIKAMALKSLKELSGESSEMGQLLRKWIPKIHVLPYQLRRQGQPVQRAFFTLDLTSFLPCKAYQQQFGHVLQKQMVVDLFEMPAREKLRPQIVKLKKEGYQHRQIASMLGTYTQTVHLALQLQREMDERGLSHALLPIQEPPCDSNKWTRHKHVRFQFKPMPGYPLSLGD